MMNCELFFGYKHEEVVLQKTQILGYPEWL
jgi:hypothetical protein